MPLTLKILSTYGDNETVRSTIGSSLRTFSWWGTANNYYEKMIGICEEIKTQVNHQPKVIEWADEMIKRYKQDIIEENQRMEERKLTGY